MKWNIFVGSLVLGLGLSTQSFGFDLLDRMLGADYGGCCEKAACCETSCGCEVDPGCGCDDGCATKGCGKAKCRRPLLDLFKSHKCNSGCADKCCDVDPGCGCEVVDPGCGCNDGCDSKCGAKKCCRRPLLDLFKRSCKSGCADKCCDVDPGCGCEVVDPGCGCDDGCSSKGCGRKKLNLLDRIFGCKRCKTSCCEPACGCDPGCGCEPDCGVPMKGFSPKEADVDEAAPVPPAPVVDPSAFLPTKRHFIQTNLVR